MFKFSRRSLDNLQGVATPLQLIVSRALLYTTVDFGITSGLRTAAEQRELVNSGKSMTMNSYHLTGKAVDLVAYIGSGISWDWKYYEELNVAMQRAAAELGFHITWGGSWNSFKDGAHWQLED